MGLLSRFLGRGKQVDGEFKKGLTQIALGGELARPLTEQEMREQLGINVHMIDDETLTKFLEDLSKGIDGKGNQTIDLDAASLRILASKLLRTSYIEPIDALIGQLEVENLIARMELEMNEEEYELGGTNFLEATGQLIKTAYSDSVNGRKAKLLKVTPKAFEINIPEQDKKKKGGFF